MTRVRGSRLAVGLAGLLLIGSCATEPDRLGDGAVRSAIVVSDTAIRSRSFEAAGPDVFESVELSMSMPVHVPRSSIR